MRKTARAGVQGNGGTEGSNPLGLQTTSKIKNHAPETMVGTLSHIRTRLCSNGGSVVRWQKSKTVLKSKGIRGTEMNTKDGPRWRSLGKGGQLGKVVQSVQDPVQIKAEKGFSEMGSEGQEVGKTSFRKKWFPPVNPLHNQFGRDSPLRNGVGGQGADKWNGHRHW